jgi:hypothetical protein
MVAQIYHCYQNSQSKSFHGEKYGRFTEDRAEWSGVVHGTDDSV